MLMLKKFFSVARLMGFFLLCSFLGLIFVFCRFYCKPEDGWVVRCGNQNISEGEYVIMLNRKLVEARSKLFGSDQMGFEQEKLDYKKLEQGHIGKESKKTFDWVRDEVKDMAEKFLLVRKNFDEKGYGSNPEFELMVDKNLPDEEDWDNVYANLEGKMRMSASGISKKALFKFVTDDILKNSFVLGETFGEGKPRDFSGEIPDFIKNNFIKYKIVSVMKNDSYPGYKDQSDPNGESKLEKLEGVKTSSELVEKYMEDLKNGKRTLDEIGSSYNENFGGLGKKAEVPTNVLYAHESEFAREFVPPGVKELVSEVEPNGVATLKEDAAAYHIIQRYDLSDEDFENKSNLARRILVEIKTNEYFDELKARYPEPIEFNEKLMKKYSVAKQAKKFVENNKNTENHPVNEN